MTSSTTTNPDFAMDNAPELSEEMIDFLAKFQISLPDEMTNYEVAWTIATVLLTYAAGHRQVAEMLQGAHIVAASTFSKQGIECDCDSCTAHRRANTH